MARRGGRPSVVEYKQLFSSVDVRPISSPADRHLTATTSNTSSPSLSLLSPAELCQYGGNGQLPPLNFTLSVKENFLVQEFSDKNTKSGAENPPWW